MQFELVHAKYCSRSIHKHVCGVQIFCNVIKPHLISHLHLKSIMAAMTTVLTTSTLDHSV
jgi:hypothetical protein